MLRFGVVSLILVCISVASDAAKCRDCQSKKILRQVIQQQNNQANSGDTNVHATTTGNPPTTTTTEDKPQRKLSGPGGPYLTAYGSYISGGGSFVPGGGSFMPSDGNESNSSSSSLWHRLAMFMGKFIGGGSERGGTSGGDNQGTKNGSSQTASSDQKQTTKGGILDSVYFEKRTEWPKKTNTFNPGAKRGLLYDKSIKQIKVHSKSISSSEEADDTILADNTDLGNIYMDIQKINVYPDESTGEETKVRGEIEKVNIYPDESTVEEKEVREKMEKKSDTVPEYVVRKTKKGTKKSMISVDHESKKRDRQGMKSIAHQSKKGDRQSMTSVAHESKKVGQQSMASATSTTRVPQADDTMAGSSSLLPSSGGASKIMKMPASAASTFIQGPAKSGAIYVPGTESYKNYNSSTSPFGGWPMMGKWSSSLLGGGEGGSNGLSKESSNTKTEQKKKKVKSTANIRRAQDMNELSNANNMDTVGQVNGTDKRADKVEWHMLGGDHNNDHGVKRASLYEVKSETDAEGESEDDDDDDDSTIVWIENFNVYASEYSEEAETESTETVTTTEDKRKEKSILPAKNKKREEEAISDSSIANEKLPHTFKLMTNDDSGDIVVGIEKINFYPSNKKDMTIDQTQEEEDIEREIDVIPPINMKDDAKVIKTLNPNLAVIKAARSKTMTKSKHSKSKSKSKAKSKSKSKSKTKAKGNKVSSAIKFWQETNSMYPSMYMGTIGGGIGVRRRR